MSDSSILQWRMKRQIDMLNAAKGNGTSLITLLLTPKDQIFRMSKFLTEEQGAASNIKCRVNRQSVISAISSVQHRLKLYSKVPENGLALFCGTVENNEGKERKIMIDLSPLQPIAHGLYMCDSRFHTETLAAQLEEDSMYGFVVMDGHGTLLATLQGNRKTILHQFHVDLPPKHGRGGQSANRFARIRDAARHHYVRKVSEAVNEHYSHLPSLNGLVLAGCADLKRDLQQSDLLNKNLKCKIVLVVDTAYGGMNGFHEAVNLSGKELGQLKLFQEKRLVEEMFTEITLESGRACYGVQETMHCLTELAAVRKLLLWDNLPTERLIVTNRCTGDSRVVYSHPKQPYQVNQTEVLSESTLLAEWLTEHFQNFGCELHFISDCSQEGSQFVHGFGGLGGILQYKLNLSSVCVDDVPDDEDDDCDFEEFNF